MIENKLNNEDCLETMSRIDNNTIDKEYSGKKTKSYYEPYLIHDNFQNYKVYNIPKAQLVIADIPYNIGIDAYASNPTWYIDGDNKQGESLKAKSSFFSTDGNFNLMNRHRKKL